MLASGKETLQNWQRPTLKTSEIDIFELGEFCDPFSPFCIFPITSVTSETFCDDPAVLQYLSQDTEFGNSSDPNLVVSLKCQKFHRKKKEANDKSIAEN